MKIRLNKYLSQTGICSRRESDRLIETKQIYLNGDNNIKLGTVIDPCADLIEYKGKRIESCVFEYIVFNKPVDYVVSRQAQGAKSIYELLPFNYPYIGRLDKNTTGLLLLTNDGTLAFRLTHPKYKVAKHYRVTVDKKPTPDDLMKIEKGIQLEDGLTAPAKVTLLKDHHTLEIIIKEGKKRQIRRMLSALGLDVMSLHRFKFGPVLLGNLPSGGFRHLNKNEVDSLKREVGYVK
jgi:23S rRNA pseudouridine2605 synthase